MSNDIGLIKGEQCNRGGCAGIINEHEKEGGCSCHINPPCGYCTANNQYCPTCGWEAKDDEDLPVEPTQQQKNYWAEQNNKWAEQTDLFNKKWRGEMPIDKLEMRSESHTHFSMIKKGVFPKGTETYASLLPKVVGSFGGRFTTTVDKDSFRFEYIAYTD